MNRWRGGAEGEEGLGFSSREAKREAEGRGRPGARLHDEPLAAGEGGAVGERGERAGDLGVALQVDEAVRQSGEGRGWGGE